VTTMWQTALCSAQTEQRIWTGVREQGESSTRLLPRRNDPGEGS
jgi:hypothetical protein